MNGLALRYGTLTERSIDSDAVGRSTTAAVVGMNEFAIDLFSAVATREPSNIVVSP